MINVKEKSKERLEWKKERVGEGYKEYNKRHICTGDYVIVRKFKESAEEKIRHKRGIVMNYNNITGKISEISLIRGEKNKKLEIVSLVEWYVYKINGVEIE